MNEYTEGPWTIETPCGFPYSGLYVVPVVCKDFPCYIAQIRPLREREESEANAYLIAAAPKLLEACQRFKKMVVKNRGNTVWDSNYDYFEAAIAKALPHHQG